MTAVTSKLTCIARIGLIVCLSAISDARGESDGGLKLNENAVEFASQLIRHGHLIADGKGGWHEHKPSPAAENDFIRLYGYTEYAKWHLGVDERYAVNSKRRYKFPYGDFKDVHRCGLLAAKARARLYRYAQISNAAAELEAAVKQRH